MNFERTPTAYDVARPNYFGIPPRGLVAGLAVVAAAGGVVALVAGEVAAAALLLVAALLLCVAVFGVPVGRARTVAGFAGRTAGAWAQAAHEVARLRLERRNLERRRRTTQYELGGAALETDAGLVDDLRRRLRTCIDELERNEADRHAAVARARNRTSEERSAAARTEITERPS